MRQLESSPRETKLPVLLLEILPFATGLPVLDDCAELLRLDGIIWTGRDGTVRPDVDRELVLVIPNEHKVVVDPVSLKGSV